MLKGENDLEINLGRVMEFFYEKSKADYGKEVTFENKYTVNILQCILKCWWKLVIYSSSRYM